MILLILLCFEALLFLIFTSVMFGTQVHSICTDETVSASHGLLAPSSASAEPGRGCVALPLHRAQAPLEGSAVQEEKQCRVVLPGAACTAGCWLGRCVGSTSEPAGTALQRAFVLIASRTFFLRGVFLQWHCLQFTGGTAHS